MLFFILRSRLDVTGKNIFLFVNYIHVLGN